MGAWHVAGNLPRPGHHVPGRRLVPRDLCLRQAIGERAVERRPAGHGRELFASGGPAAPAADDIVVAGTGMLIGYDPRSGRRRWWAKVLLRIQRRRRSRGRRDLCFREKRQNANQWIVSVDGAAQTGNNDNKLDKAEIQAFVGRTSCPRHSLPRHSAAAISTTTAFLKVASSMRLSCTPIILRGSITRSPAKTQPSKSFWRCASGGRRRRHAVAPFVEAQNEVHRSHRVLAA